MTKQKMANKGHTRIVHVYRSLTIVYVVSVNIITSQKEIAYCIPTYFNSFALILAYPYELAALVVLYVK